MNKVHAFVHRYDSCGRRRGLAQPQHALHYEPLLQRRMAATGETDLSVFAAGSSASGYTAHTYNSGIGGGVSDSGPSGVSRLDSSARPAGPLYGPWMAEAHATPGELAGVCRRPPSRQAECGTHAAHAQHALHGASRRPARSLT